MAVGDNRTVTAKRHTTVRFRLPADSCTQLAAVVRDRPGRVYNSRRPETEPKHNDQQSHSLSQGQGHPKLTPAMDGDANTTSGHMNSVEAVASPDGNRTPPKQLPKASPETQNGTMEKSGSAEMLDDAGSKNSGKDRHSSGTSNDSRGKPSAADTAKAKEREERLRQAKEKAAQEHMKKLEELREAQKKAREFRKKQEEERRRKLEEMRRKEESHRNLVEERRKRIEMEDWNRRQAILRRSAEREAKLEQIRTSSRRSTATPPMKRPKSSQSDLAMSASSDGSPIRRPRPHSVAGRLPSYASPTVSSQIRMSRDSEKKSSGSVSPGPKRSKSADTRRSRADIQRTFERLAMPRVVPTKDTPRDTQRPAVPRSLPKDIKINTAAAARGVLPNKAATGPAKDTTSTKVVANAAAAAAAAHKDKVAPVKQAPPKEKTLPQREKATPPRDRAPTRERPATRETAPDHKKAANAERPAPREKSASAKDRVPVSKVPRDKPVAQKEKVITKQPQPTKALNKEKVNKAAIGAAKEKVAPKEKVSHKEVKKEKPAEIKTKKPAEAKPAEAKPAEAKPAEAKPAEAKPAVEEAIKPATAAPASSALLVTEKPEKAEKAAELEALKKPSAEKDNEKKAKEPSAAPTKEAPKEKTPTKEVAPAIPGAAPTQQSKPMTKEEEYKAKLAENRRLAREKAEREAEEERKRQEEIRRQEEERRRREEEEERRQMEEAMRLAEEARKAEEERLRKAVEAEEKRKKEEAERLEAERKAKEEAERRAQEEAERKERERAEKAKREEEERLERKKRLEMIMKRTRKNDEGKLESPGSPSKSVVTPPKQVTPTESPPQQQSPMEESVSAPGSTSPPREVTSPGETTDSVRPQKLPLSSVTKDDAPKFKSPLLQQILGGRTRAKTADKNGEDNQQEAGKDTVASPEKKPSEEAVSLTNIEVEVSREDNANMAEKARNFVESVVSKVTESMQGAKEPEPVEPAPAPTLEQAPESTNEPTPEPVVEPGSEPAKEPTAEPVVEPGSEPVNKEEIEGAPVSEPAIELTSEPVIESAKEPGVESAGIKPAEETPADFQDTESVHQPADVETTLDGGISDHLDAAAVGSEQSSEASEGIATPVRPGSEQIEEGAEPSSPDKKSFTDTDHLMAADEDKDIDTSGEAADLVNSVGYSVTVTSVTTSTRTEREAIQDDSNRLMNGYTVKDTDLSQTDSLLAEPRVNGTSGVDTTCNADQPLADFGTLDNKNVCQVTSTGDSSQLIDFDADFINSNAPESQLQADNKTMAKDSTPGSTEPSSSGTLDSSITDENVTNVHKERVVLTEHDVVVESNILGHGELTRNAEYELTGHKDVDAVCKDARVDVDAVSGGDGVKRDEGLGEAHRDSAVSRVGDDSVENVNVQMGGGVGGGVDLSFGGGTGKQAPEPDIMTTSVIMETSADFVSDRSASPEPVIGSDYKQQDIMTASILLDSSLDEMQRTKDDTQDMQDGELVVDRKETTTNEIRHISSTEQGTREVSPAEVKSGDQEPVKDHIPKGSVTEEVSSISKHEESDKGLVITELVTESAIPKDGQHVVMTSLEDVKDNKPVGPGSEKRVFEAYDDVKGKETVIHEETVTTVEYTSTEMDPRKMSAERDLSAIAASSDIMTTSMVLDSGVDFTFDNQRSVDMMSSSIMLQASSHLPGAPAADPMASSIMMDSTSDLQMSTDVMTSSVMFSGTDGLSSGTLTDVDDDKVQSKETPSDSSSQRSVDDGRVTAQPIAADEEVTESAAQQERDTLGGSAPGLTDAGSAVHELPSSADQHEEESVESVSAVPCTEAVHPESVSQQRADQRTALTGEVDDTKQHPDAQKPEQVSDEMAGAASDRPTEESLQAEPSTTDAKDVPADLRATSLKDGIDSDSEHSTTSDQEKAHSEAVLMVTSDQENVDSDVGTSDKENILPESQTLYTSEKISSEAVITAPSADDTDLAVGRRLSHEDGQLIMDSLGGDDGFGVVEMSLSAVNKKTLKKSMMGDSMIVQVSDTEYTRASLGSEEDIESECGASFESEDGTESKPRVGTGSEDDLEIKQREWARSEGQKGGEQAASVQSEHGKSDADKAVQEHDKQDVMMTDLHHQEISPSAKDVSTEADHLKEETHDLDIKTSVQVESSEKSLGHDAEGPRVTQVGETVAKAEPPAAGEKSEMASESSDQMSNEKEETPAQQKSSPREHSEDEKPDSEDGDVVRKTADSITADGSSSVPSAAADDEKTKKASSEQIITEKTTELVGEVVPGSEAPVAAVEQTMMVEETLDKGRDGSFQEVPSSPESGSDEDISHSVKEVGEHYTAASDDSEEEMSVNGSVVCAGDIRDDKTPPLEVAHEPVDSSAPGAPTTTAAEVQAKPAVTIPVISVDKVPAPPEECLVPIIDSVPCDAIRENQAASSTPSSPKSDIEKSSSSEDNKVEPGLERSPGLIEDAPHSEESSATEEPAVLESTISVLREERVETVDDRLQKMSEADGGESEMEHEPVGSGVSGEEKVAERREVVSDAPSGWEPAALVEVSAGQLSPAFSGFSGTGLVHTTTKTTTVEECSVIEGSQTVQTITTSTVTTSEMDSEKHISCETGLDRAQPIEQSTAEQVEHTSAEKLEKSSAEEVEKSSAEEVEKLSAEHVEKSSAEEVEKSSAEEVDKSSAEHVEKSSAEEVEKSSAEQVEKSSAEHVEKSSAEHVEKSSAEQVEKSSVEQVEKSSTEHVETSSAEQVEKSSAEQVEKSSAEEVEKPSAEHVEKSSAEHVEKSSAEQVEKSSAEQVEKSSAEHVERSSAEHVERSSAEQVEKSSAEHVETSSAEHVETSSAEHVEKSSAEQVEKSSAEEVEKSSAEHVEKLSAEHVEKSSVEQVEKSSAEQVEKSSVEHLEQTSAEHLERSSAEEVEHLEHPSAEYVKQTSLKHFKHTSVEHVEQSSAEQVEKSSTEHVEQPSTEQVEQPSTEQVEQPSTEQVEQPSTEHVEQPSTEHVEQPSTEQVEQPSTEQVEKSSAEHVQKSSVEHPSAEEEEDSYAEQLERQSAKRAEQQSAAQVECPSARSVEHPPAEEEDHSFAEQVEHSSAEQVEQPSDERVEQAERLSADICRVDAAEEGSSLREFEISPTAEQWEHERGDYCSASSEDWSGRTAGGGGARVTECYGGGEDEDEEYASDTSSEYSYNGAYVAGGAETREPGGGAGADLDAASQALAERILRGRGAGGPSHRAEGRESGGGGGDEAMLTKDDLEASDDASSSFSTESVSSVEYVPQRAPSVGSDVTENRDARLTASTERGTAPAVDSDDLLNANLENPEQ